MQAQHIDSSILVFESDSKTGMLLRISHDVEGSIIYESETIADASLVPGVNVIVIDAKLDDIGEVVDDVRKRSRAPIVVTSMGLGRQGPDSRADPGESSLGPRFHSGELLVQIREALACLMPDDSTVVMKMGAFSFNLSDRSVFVQGEQVTLTRTEYDVLRLLVTNAGHVGTHEQLLARVWDSHESTDTTRLRIMIRRLREKIEPDPSRPAYILSQPGIGYRLEVPAE